MKELTDQLEQGVRNVFSSGQYEQYLNTMSQFHQYSFRNSMLIWLQRPDATRVAGFNTWKNTFGRSVNKGEKGIRIFAPAPYKRRVEETHDQQGNPLRDEKGNSTTRVKEITVPAFKPVPVFDVSQTSGRELPSLSSELSGDVNNYNLLFESLEKISPYPIVFEKIEGSAEGYCDFTNQRIVLNEGKPQAQNVAVALHELVHARLHNPTLPPELQKDRQTEEIEAESTAFVVGAHYGIQTDASSFGYVASWSQDKELSKLQASLDTIQKAAAELIHDIDTQMQELTQQREAEQPQFSQPLPVEQSPVYRLIDEWEEYGTPNYHNVFGREEKDMLVNYDFHQPNFDEVALLASQLAEAKYELGHGYANPDVKKRITEFCDKIDHLTGLQENSTPQQPIHLDAPFVPMIEILNTVDHPKKSGLLKYQVAENDQVYGLNGDEDSFFPVNTVELDTGEKTVVGFNRLREYTFEANAYRNCLFENNAADIGTKNLHFADRPGTWEIIDKLALRDDTYFAVTQQQDSRYEMIPERQYMIVDQTGASFIDQAFKDMETWEKKDFLDLVSSTLAKREAERINGDQSDKIMSKEDNNTSYSGLRKIVDNETGKVIDVSQTVNSYQNEKIALNAAKRMMIPEPFKIDGKAAHCEVNVVCHAAPPHTQATEKPSIGDKLIKAKQSIDDHNATHKPEKRTTRAGMER
ncbi:ArdC-like ssDNA-binding domain-containing protein (plasmid) [Oscillospiraceae bacterium PP1C4]